MAVNTQKLSLGKLTIKYSPDYPIGSFGVEKIKVALEIAKRAVAKSVNELHRLRSPAIDGVTIPWDLGQNFRFHRSRKAMDRLGKMNNNAYFEKLDRSNSVHFLSLAYHFCLEINDRTAYEWPEYIHRITDNFSKILTGLNGNISIADAHATLINKYYARAAEKWDRRDPGTLLAAMEQEGERVSRIDGVVTLKKAFVKTLTPDQIDKGADKMLKVDGTKGWVPYVDITPEDRGSIHLNFQRLLRPDNPASDLRVARILIHEASHKFCNTDDYAYAPRGDGSAEDLFEKDAYAIQQPMQMIWNADSYAYAAMCLYKGEFIETDQGMPRD